MRAKMIDWMIEVMKSFNNSEQTFNLAVSIMDQFFEKTTK